MCYHSTAMRVKCRPCTRPPCAHAPSLSAGATAQAQGAQMQHMQEAATATMMVCQRALSVRHGPGSSPPATSSSQETAGCGDRRERGVGAAAQGQRFLLGPNSLAAPCVAGPSTLMSTSRCLRVLSLLK